MPVGCRDGQTSGCRVGRPVGLIERQLVGRMLDCRDGFDVGSEEGKTVGYLEENTDGCTNGRLVG